MGIADYPFLPRAYTAINDQELLDVLLMSTNLAHVKSALKNEAVNGYISKPLIMRRSTGLQQVTLEEACKHAVNQGLIKIQSSQNEDNIKKMLKRWLICDGWDLQLVTLFLVCYYRCNGISSKRSWSVYSALINIYGHSRTRHSRATPPAESSVGTSSFDTETLRSSLLESESSKAYRYIIKWRVRWK